MTLLGEGFKLYIDVQLIGDTSLASWAMEYVDSSRYGWLNCLDGTFKGFLVSDLKLLLKTLYLPEAWLELNKILSWN
jgi:hypothetical protein